VPFFFVYPLAAFSFNVQFRIRCGFNRLLSLLPVFVFPFTRIRAMKIISRIIAIILFLAFFGLALKNTHLVTLNFFLGYQRTDPLAMILLVCFAVGALLGVLAMTPAVFRHRREAGRQRKALIALQKEREAALRAQNEPPAPDSINSAQYFP
jgi:putative membrane protein